LHFEGIPGVQGGGGLAADLLRSQHDQSERPGRKGQATAAVDSWIEQDIAASTARAAYGATSVDDEIVMA
jgi:hypothetical protein